jgi:inosine-uridine nucleoside N-ribohydrolase
MTNLALAISLDPQFAELTGGLVFMGGSLNPRTNDPEYADDPRHEFNLWFDPEAAHIVLRAHWPSIVCTTVDVSVKTQLTRAMFEAIAKSSGPLGNTSLNSPLQTAAISGTNWQPPHGSIPASSPGNASSIWT